MERAIPEFAPDYERRFGGVARLYGKRGEQKIQSLHAVVVGIGGVGSWAAEALARSAVGKITLVDLDNVAESNTNRQIMAMSGQYGRPKVEAMAERIALINPSCQLELVEEFVEAANPGQWLPEDAVVLDCIDDSRVKAAMIAFCRRRGQLIVTCGAAGGRRDPLRIRCEDLARAQGDPLLARVRHSLRKHYGFSKRPEKKTAPKFGVPAFFSDEPIQRSSEQCGVQTMGGLSCAGYGSAVVVTATMGLAAAAYVLNQQASLD